jgi:hypothetical protein
VWKFIFISTLIFLGCKKPSNTPKTITVTYFLKTQLGPNEKLFVSYMASYNTAIQYQYGQLINDTLNTDNFRATVTYTVNDPKMKGKAGYLQFTYISYSGGHPYTLSHPYWKNFCAIVNGDTLRNYSQNGNYSATEVNW